jgi:hypothetical protein
MSDHCRTPDWLWKALDAEFAFDLDPCPLSNPFHRDGLELDWTGKRVFCNPPYSSILPWVEKALSSNALIVFLIPKRFDALWCRMLRDSRAEIRIFERDVRFEVLGQEKTVKPVGGSMIAIVRRLDRS